MVEYRGEVENSEKVTFDDPNDIREFVRATRGVVLMRRAAKRDANEREIIQALRAAGATVVALNGIGVPDLLVGYKGRNYLLEVKNPETHGKLTRRQQTLHDLWRGVFVVVETPREALEAIGAEVAA